MGRTIDADVMRQYWLENGENEYVYDTNSVLESIDAQPTVDAAPKWIPVTEQWYPGPGRILATDGKQIYITNGEWFYRSPDGKIRIPANYGAGADVTHWMPLPELPKMDEEAENEHDN